MATSSPPLALITGASRGIGRAFACRLAKDGYRLLLCARNEAALRALGQELESRHRSQCQLVVADLSQPAGVQALLSACAAQPIDLLINNAGVGLGNTFAEQAPDALAAMLHLNVVALTEIMRGVLPTILARKGNIINVASQAAFFPMPRLAAYAASKAYVLSLTEAVAEELRGQPIHVMALCPGPTATGFFTEADIDVKQTHMHTAPVDQVVDEGLRALHKRKRIYVVGWFNRLSTWAPRILPRHLITKMNLRFMKR